MPAPFAATSHPRPADRFPAADAYAAKFLHPFSTLFVFLSEAEHSPQRGILKLTIFGEVDMVDQTVTWMRTNPRAFLFAAALV